MSPRASRHNSRASAICFACLCLGSFCLLALGAGPASAATLAIDKSVSTHQSSASSSITSPTFTTAKAGELLLAFVTSDGPSGGGSQTISKVTGGGLTWRLRQRANAQAGTSEIWTANAPAVLTNATVTATRGTGSYVGAIAVVSFTGADRVADGPTAAASGASGGPSATLTATRAGSMVWGVGNDWDRAVARTVGAGQTKVDEFLASAGDTLWVQRQTSPTPLGGTAVTLNDTAPTNDRWNMAAIEVLPEVEGPPDTTPPTVSLATPADGATVSGNVNLTATASDASGIAGVQFLLDGNPVGAEDTSSPYGLSWDSTAVSNGSHTLAARAKDGAGNVATSTAATVNVENSAPDKTPPVVSLMAPANGATVSGSVNLTATASDASGIAGVQFLLDGNPVGAEDTSSPYGLSWDSTTVSNGSHEIAARAKDGAGNVATSTGATVTVENGKGEGPPLPLELDKTASTHQATGATTISAPALSTSHSGELLLAFIASDGPNAAGGQSITGVSGGGLTWTLRRRSNTQAGTAEVWQAVAPSALTNVTITATRASAGYQGSITVAAFIGADTAGGGATASASATTGAPSVSLTTTRAGSWVWGVGDDWDAAKARTLGAGQEMVDQFLASAGDTFWVQRRSAPTPAAGTPVTIDDTAPTGDRWNMAAVEVLAASAP